MSVRSGIGLLCAGLVLSGCADAFFGPPPPRMNDAIDLKPGPRNVRQDAATLKAAIRRELSIGNEAPTGDVTPTEYVKAGYNFVFRNCSNYFDALIAWQNTNHYTNDVVTAGGSAAGAILGLAKASSGAIGGVAAGVGFASTAITAFDARALVTPYPNETKTLILSQLATYRETVPPDSVTDDAAAIANVQRFAEVCTYSGISRAAKQALSNYRSEVTKPGATAPAPLAQVVSAKLGLTTELTPAELVALYVWVEASPPVWDDPAAGGRVRASLEALGARVADANGAVDPKALDALVGDDLRTAYAADADLRAAVRDYQGKLAAARAVAVGAPLALGAAPLLPHRRGARRRPAPVAAAPPSPVEPTRVTPDPSLLARPFLLGPAQAKVPAENIGQFDLSRPKADPR